MPEKKGLTALGKLTVAVFVVACLAGAYVYLRGVPRDLAGMLRGGQRAGGTSAPAVSAEAEIGVAYGTEKKLWLEWAAKEFASTDAGRRIRVNLLPMGSLDGAQALVAGDRRINAWSPASRIYEGIFTLDWQARIGGNPILKSEDLALTPMVFVWWEERYQAFIRKYGSVTFDTLAKALAEPGGWATIAGKPEWGVFKLGHTHPNQSNSGLAALLIMAYDHGAKTKGLTLADILDPGFQQYMASIEGAVTGLSPSTGTMMREMVLKGPSAFDVLLSYESVALDYLKSAEGRWGSLRIVYPARNIWNENPFYIIDAPWSSPEQRQAALAFLDFLLSDPVQRESLQHGFRPGNPAVPIKTPDSPFTVYARYGVQIEPGSVCETPKPEVVTNLLAIWQRRFGGR